MTDGSKRGAKAMARHCLPNALSGSPLGCRAGLLALWLVACIAGFLDRPTTASAEPPISITWINSGELSSLTPRTITVGLSPRVDARICEDWGIVDPGTIVDIRPLPPIPSGDPIYILPAPPAVDPVPPPPPSGPSHDLSIYLSEIGSIGSGLALDNPIQHYPQVGESGSLFVWMAPGDALLMGAGLNVVSSNPGVLSFSGANVLNPDIFAPRPDDPHALVPRWQGANSGKVSTDAVTGMAGAIVTEGLGVSGRYDGSGPTGALDPLLDPDTGSLLFAEINYDVIGEGSTDLFLQIGEIGINVVDGHSRQSEVYFGAGETSSLNGYTNRGVSSSLYDARVNVGAGPFPEPSASIAPPPVPPPPPPMPSPIPSPIPPPPPPSDSIATQEVTIFLSDIGAVGEGLTRGNAVQEHAQAGESGSLFVWIDPDDAALRGVGLSVTSSNPGIVSFSGARVLNPEIVSTQAPDLELSMARWQGVSAMPKIEITDDSIGPLNAATVTEGLNLSAAYDGSGELGLLDPLLDPETGALLFAQIDYDVIGEGMTDLFLQISTIGIGPVGGQTKDVEVYFGDGEFESLNGETDRGVSSAVGDARIYVGDGPFDELIIPEPDQLVTDETDAEGEGIAGLDEDPIVGNLENGVIDTVSVALHTDGDSTFTFYGSTYIASTFDDSPNSLDTFIGAPLDCDFGFTTVPLRHLTVQNEFPNAAAPFGAGADSGVPEPGGFLLALSLIATIGLATGGRRRL